MIEAEKEEAIFVFCLDYYNLSMYGFGKTDNLRVKNKSLLKLNTNFSCR